MVINAKLYKTKVPWVLAVKWDRSDRARHEIEDLIGEFNLSDRYPGDYNWPCWEFVHNNRWHRFSEGDWVTLSMLDKVKVMTDEEFKEMFWTDDN